MQKRALLEVFQQAKNMSGVGLYKAKPYEDIE